MSSISSGGFSVECPTLTCLFSKNCNSYFYREFIRELSRDLKAKPKQSLSGGAKGGGSNTTRSATSQQQTNNRVISLLSRMSAATNIGGQRSTFSPQNTFDSRNSQISQMGQSQQSNILSPRQSLVSQVRLSTLLRSNRNNIDSDSDVSV